MVIKSASALLLWIGLAFGPIFLIGSCATNWGNQDASVTDPSNPKIESPSPGTGDSDSDEPVTTSEPRPFRTAIELQGINFQIESPNVLVGNTVSVIPSGLQVSNDTFTSPVNGVVFDAQAGDLNVDQSPEVYVFVREHNGRGRVQVIGYATNSRKSMSEFSLPSPDLDTKEYAGYNGSDEFQVIENVLSRRFPLFEEIGGQLKSTGKTRIIQYKIRSGEATWQFYVKRVDEF